VRGRPGEEEQSVMDKWGAQLKELLQQANKVGGRRALAH
jgi:hypothetical protein